MSFTDSPYTSADLIGKTAVPRNEVPSLRGALRRSDPDGGSAVAYFAGLSGKTLSVEYTDSSLSPLTADIAFGSNGYAAAITTINAEDATNLEAVDQDGFLVLRNKNSGDQHYIKVTPFATPASDAAPILGFEVDPFPGSVSYAGEISSSPATRQQLNYFGTALIAKDEGLSASAVNRGFASVLRYVDRLKADLDREVVLVKEIAGGTSAVHPVSTGINTIFLNDNTTRLPIGGVGLPAASTDLSDFFEVMDSFGQTLYNTDGTRVQVTNVFYADSADTLNPAASFTAWGTPDGGSIYGNTVPSKVKHASIAIDSIKGDVVYVATATFETAHVQQGDPVLIENATNTSPFSHNGWFVVEQVIDETHLQLRPMALNEDAPDAGARPRELNPATGGAFGDLSVYIGSFVTCSSLYFAVNCPAGTVVSIRGKAGGTKLRDSFSSQPAINPVGTQNKLGVLITDHIADTSAAHAAASIGGFTSATTWKDASTITGADLKATIENILTDLANVTSGQGGTRRIGADAVSIAGAAPNSLTSGSLRDQLVELLTDIQTHVNDGVAHAGAGSPYGGSAPSLWADGTDIASGITIDQAITEIVSVFGQDSYDGGNKVGIGSRPAWLGGRTNPGSVSLITALSKIINDLAATTTSDDGAERIGAAAATDLASGSVRSQLDLLATQWGKLARSNTWSAAQTVNGAAGDTSPALLSTAVPVARKLLWEMTLGTSTYKARLYASVAGELEITINAVWDGTQWVRDTGTANNSSKYVFSRNNFQVFFKSSGASFLDSAWNNSNVAALDLAFLAGQLRLAPVPSASTTGMGAYYTGGNVIRAWGVVQTSASTPTVQSGFNISGVNFSISGNALDVDLGDSMASGFSMMPMAMTIIDGGSVTKRTYDVEVLDSNTFRIRVYDNGVAVLLQTSTPIIYIGFVVLGNL